MKAATWAPLVAAATLCCLLVAVDAATTAVVRAGQRERVLFQPANHDAALTRLSRVKRPKDPNQYYKDADGNVKKIPRLAHIGLPSCPSFPFCSGIPAPPPTGLGPAIKPLPFQDVPGPVGAVKMGAGDEARTDGAELDVNGQPVQAGPVTPTEEQ